MNQSNGQNEKMYLLGGRNSNDIFLGDQKKESTKTGIFWYMIHPKVRENHYCS